MTAAAERKTKRNVPHPYVPCLNPRCFDVGQHCDICGRPELATVLHKQATK